MSGNKMVDTRRLEKLVSIADPGNPGARLSRDLGISGQRALALSGHLDHRRAGVGRVRSAQREAVIAARWDALPRCVPDSNPDKAMRQFNAQSRTSDVVSRFDLLRAQLVQTFRERKLVSLGIAGPTDRNGASFAVAGLLAAFARRGDQRVIGLDLNQRNATLHRYFELSADRNMRDLITAAVPAEGILQRLTETVALGLSAPGESAVEPGFHAQDIGTMLDALTAAYAPEFVICDLPPLLQGDACLEICDQLDSVLLVADARRTRADEMLASERLLTGRCEFLGMILNHYTGSEQL